MKTTEAGVGELLIYYGSIILSLGTILILRVLVTQAIRKAFQNK